METTQPESGESVDLRGTYLGELDLEAKTIKVHEIAVMDGEFSVPVMWETRSKATYEPGQPVTVSIMKYSDGSLGKVSGVSARAEGEPWDCTMVQHGVVSRAAEGDDSFKVYVNRNLSFKVGHYLAPDGMRVIVGDGLLLRTIYDPRVETDVVVSIEFEHVVKSDDITQAIIRFRKQRDGEIRIREFIVSPFLQDNTPDDANEGRAIVIYAWHKQLERFKWLMVRLDPFPPSHLAKKHKFNRKFKQDSRSHTYSGGQGGDRGRGDSRGGFQQRGSFHRDSSSRESGSRGFGQRSNTPYVRRDDSPRDNFRPRNEGGRDQNERFGGQRQRFTRNSDRRADNRSDGRNDLPPSSDE